MLIITIFILSLFGPTFIKLIKFGLVYIFWKKEIPDFTLDVIEKYTPGGFLVILFLCAIYYLTNLRIQYNIQKETAYKAESLTKEVQLKMLRYQINPHFLFNVLNSIHALIDENAAKAKKLVVEMSEFYRYTLNKQEQTTPLEKEVDAIIKYLEIQKIRFEDKFEYKISIDEAIKQTSIPSFVIHLLVENAVKYGIISNEQKLNIHFSAKLINKNILIEVSNNGKLTNTAFHSKNNIDGTGNGIENIKNRLALFYQGNYSFLLKEENGWVIASIEIFNIHL